ncbi:glutathione S-transferase [Auriscalpium vulgare]|uniref:Glutathione S-transferase n=1 Tax=Auriscalpium vulgare TaxID=40419 RepID=A0ACB8RWJ7_9AGAM|nr:glutathione S-transferase [Auriscalpium vulgare]
MVLKLYGGSMSTCTRRVAVVAREAGVPYELVVVDHRNKQHKTPEYLKHQPFGLIPYIQDEDGFELYESRAICRYIATLESAKDTTLVPKGRKANALFEQAMSIEQNNFDPLASAIAKEKVFNPMNGIQPNEAHVAELVEQLKSKLDVYDVILGKQKYLAGNEITLADLFHLSFGSLLVATGLGLFEERPNVSRWWTDITTRPSWLAVKDGA